MSSVLLCNMHNNVFDSFCRMFKHLGIKVYCPKYGEENYFHYDGNSLAPSIVNDYAIEARREELSGLDIDFVLCCCWEQLIGAKKLAEELKIPLVLRAGNNNVPYTSNHSKFLISNDIQTYESKRIPNSLFFYLVPNYDEMIPHMITTNSFQRSKIISTFIHYYESYWRGSYDIYDDIRKATPEYTFLEFGYSKEDVKKHKYIPVLGRKADIYNIMGISKALLHIKEMEGYGWTMLEAAAIGLPIIAHRDFVKGKTCETFLKEGVTALFLNKPTHHADFVRYMNNEAALHDINYHGPRFIRQLINMERECEKLGKFLENVIK